MFNPTFSDYEVKLDHHYREVRGRLMCPQAVRPDVPIELRRPIGLTGWQVEQNRLEAIARAKEAVKKAQETIIAAQAEFPEIDFLLPHYPRTGKFPYRFIKKVKKIVAKEFGIDVIDIDAGRRNHTYVVPRHVAIYLCKTLTLKSTPQLGEEFGDRDHTTVMHAIKATERRMRENKELCETIVDLLTRLEVGLAEWRAAVP